MCCGPPSARPVRADVDPMRWLAVLLGVRCPARRSRRDARVCPGCSRGSCTGRQAWRSTRQPIRRMAGGTADEARERGFSDGPGRGDAGRTPAAGAGHPRATAAQAELNPGFSRYLDARLTPAHVDRGRELSSDHATLLARASRRSSRCSGASSSRSGVSNRATAASPAARRSSRRWRRWPGNRAAPTFFRGELFDALTMVQRRHIEARVDDRVVGRRDGPDAVHAVQLSEVRRGLRRRRPARHLANQPPTRWPRSPTISRASAGTTTRPGAARCTCRRCAQAAIADGFPKRTEGCYATRNMTERRAARPMARAGRHARPTAARCPRSTSTAGLVDVGERQFLVYSNYDAILGYNCAHYYALTVGLLADRLR